jgi:hypothetical protein
LILDLLKDVPSSAVAIGGIAVGALGWRQIDPGFATFFDDAMVKVGADLSTSISVSRGLHQSV